MGGSWDQIWPTGALRGPWGPPKGHLGAKTSPFRAPGVQKGPDTRSKCTWIMNLTQAGQCGAVGTKSGPLGPSKDLVGPQKGLLGPKRALLGPPGAQRGPDTRSKCVLTMNLTQSGQWGAVGTKSGSSGALRSFSSS